MNNEPNSGKSRLLQAIQSCEHAYYASLPQSDEPIRYSKRYLKNIRSLCRKSENSPLLSDPTEKKRQGRFWTNSHGIKKCAAVALLTAALFFTGIFSVLYARTTVTEYLTKIYESFTEIFSFGRDIEKAPSTVETVYAPSSLPPDYTQTESYIAQSEVKFTWENGSGERIFFIQTTLSSKSTIDNEDLEQTTLRISEVKCYIVQKNGRICLRWNTKDYSFTLIVPETVTYEQYCSTVDSVQPKNTPSE